MSWYKTHEEELEKVDFCTSDRFSADGARTRATRVIRWRVLVVRAAKGEPKEGEQDVQVVPGRRVNRHVCVCVRVCRCALCVPEGADPRTVSAHRKVS